VLLVSIYPAVWYFRRLKRYGERWRLIRPMQVATVVPVVLAAVMAVDFNDFFIDFHKILFRNNDWLFDPSLDPIITALPDTFFLHCFIMAFALFEAGLVWLYCLGRRSFKHAGE